MGRLHKITRSQTSKFYQSFYARKNIRSLFEVRKNYKRNNQILFFNANITFRVEGAYALMRQIRAE